MCEMQRDHEKALEDKFRSVSKNCPWAKDCNPEILDVLVEGAVECKKDKKDCGVWHFIKEFM